MRAEEGVRAKDGRFTAAMRKRTFELLDCHVFLSLVRAYGWMILSGESMPSKNVLKARTLAAC